MSGPVDLFILIFFNLLIISSISKDGASDATSQFLLILSTWKTESFSVQNTLEKNRLKL